MKKQYCVHCGELIPWNWAQAYHSKVGGFHIACMSEWSELEIKVYKVSYDGESYLTDEIPELNEGETMIETTMKNTEFWSLDEFKGF